MLITISIALASFYFFLLTGLAIGIFLLPRRLKDPLYEGISVITAARNEEQNIRNLIDSILKQEYPKDRFELIIVSDRSTDNTEKIVRDYEGQNVKLFSIEEGTDTVSCPYKGGKKRALALGIANARFNILVFTDADCVPDRDWLYEVDCHFGKEVDFVAGYSPLKTSKQTLLMKLKNLERLSMFAVSAGSIGWNFGMTCTGRNMAYRKELYDKVQGFRGIEDIRSGDDDLMLQRMTPHARKMSFMFTADSVVPSYESKDLAKQLDQETRRASKWRYYPITIKVITSLVFLFYLALLALITGFILRAVPLTVIIIVLVSKMVSEFILLAVFAVKMKQTAYLWLFPLAELIYVPYFIFFGLKGTFGKYRWRE